jgi:hypothetical protein
MHPVPINKSQHLSIADDGFDLGGAPEAAIKTENPVGEAVPGRAMAAALLAGRNGLLVLSDYARTPLPAALFR